MKARYWSLIICAGTLFTVDTAWQAPSLQRFLLARQRGTSQDDHEFSMRRSQFGRTVTKWRSLPVIGEEHPPRPYTLLVFLGSCAPCAERHIPYCRELAKKRPDFGLYVVATDTEDRVRTFSKKAHLPVRIDTDHTLALEVGANSYPTTFVLNDRDRVLDASMPKEYIGMAFGRFEALPKHSQREAPQ